MKPILALSTCWCSHRHTDGYAMLMEMAGLGFSHVELSHGIRITLVPGILKAAAGGVVAISSTHNFCPLPTGVSEAAPNLYEPSALGAQEHDQWVRHTKRSIDFAAQVGARVLVCHLGSVHFPWFPPGTSLRKYLTSHPQAGRSGESRYQALLQRSLLRLHKRMPRHWSRVTDAIGAVLDHAREKGVRLGIENREGFEELPMDSEHLGFLESLGAGAPVGYWHDTGHAELKERMGLLRHREHLEGIASRILGFHLHDVDAGGRDHAPPGEGTIDFEMVSSFWRPEHVLTIELSPRASADAVLRSRERVVALIGRREGGAP